MSVLKRISVIFVSALLISAGVNGFIMPNNIIDGGMIGIALVLNYKWGFNIGMSFIVLSTPIFLVVWMYHKRYCFNSLIGMVITGILIEFSLFAFVGQYYHPLLGSILGGLFVGLGIGILFLVDISTDSIDLLAQLVAFLTNYNVGIIVFFFDFIIILLASPILTNSGIILSLVTISVNGFIASLIIYLKDQSLNA